MIFWVALIFLAVAAFVFFKFEHHLRLLRIALLGLIVILVYLSMSAVLSSNEVDLSSPKGVVNAVYLYVGRLGETTVELFDIGTDTSKLVGNAVRVEDPDMAEAPGGDEGFSPIDWIADKIRKD